MSSLDTRQTTNAYWRNLGEPNDSPRFRAFLEAEFPEELDPGGMNRRRWLQLMGASMALAGMAGCRWPKAELVPLVVRPDGRVPGEPEHFATAMELGGAAIGLLVTSRDGRPVKIEGNPAHPASGGATHAYAQAAILELYDPDRSRRPRQYADRAGSRKNWDEFAAYADRHFQSLRGQQGAGLAVLADSSTSATRAALRARLLAALPQARWFEYEPLADDHERGGAIQALGAPYRTDYRLDEAEVVVCVDCDLVGAHPNAVQYARAFARRREPVAGRMNRLYAIESCLTITGAAADHRVALASGRIAAWLADLEAEVGRKLAGQETRATAHPDPVLAAIIEDLTARPGRSVLAVGPGQPAQVHAAVHRLNRLLGNVGKTTFYFADSDPQRPGHVAALSELIREMAAGKVQSIVVLGGNPVYNAPADLHFAQAFERVPMRMHLSVYENETSRKSTWHVPQAHFLESWDDVRAFDGTYSILQPLISPLYGGKTASELVAMILGEDPGDAYSLVRRTFQQLFAPRDLEADWRKAVHDGLVAGSQWPAETPALAAAHTLSAEAPPSPQPGENGLEIVFCSDAAVYDGRFANSGWLQETPRPLTKVTWDNAAVMHPATARQLGIERDTLVRLKYRGQELKLPVYLLAGHARESVSVSLGYGRTAAGKVGGDVDAAIEPVGVDANALRHSAALYFDRGLQVEATGEPYLLATTEEHHAIGAVGQYGMQERVPELVREGSLAEYEAHPEFAQHLVHHPPLKSLWEEWRYEAYRWGMSIDLNKCIGCGACLLACQAENNVPVVGRDLILKGREMHWIRVDRYFRGDPDVPSPPVSHQVMLCQQCENAPCEQVCPVNATVHSREGLNDMVYNRCIGTRYCANNCPYKVRRFNYFHFHRDLEDPDNEVKKMVFNPEVTVRSRGVMEKCTYCVQRIQAVKIAAKNERRPIVDGDIRTACQQVCPTRAIEFGDLNDQRSQVRGAHDSHRAYALLAQLNTKPRTGYLARIRNPHPSLEETDHDDGGHSG